MPQRDELIHKLQTQSLDLLIIGGGIVGAGIARDAAMRGLKVALIDQGDFASGASSKTSKLIHGGLRYLEHGRLGLVFESLRERHILRTIAPTFVRPMSLLLPVYAQDARPRWKIDAGLWLYDLLAMGRAIRGHRMASAHRATRLEPALQPEGLRGAGVYTDCQMDDTRVCLSNILQALSFGAVCCNYVRLVAFLKADQQVCGGVAEDLLTGRSFEIQAKVVVNATGPWSDQVRRMSDRYTPKRLAPTKGIHVILPQVAREALFVQAKRDGRMLFLLPWDGYTLVGTTESAVNEPLENLRANGDEVGYLLEEVNRVLPGSRVGERDVVATFAGARPLLASSGNASSASREHRIEVDRWGVVSAMGGKYTTYRAMAKDVVDQLARLHQWQLDRCLTDQVSLLETVHPVSLDQWDAARSMDPDLLARLLTRYGAGAFPILRLIHREPSLAQPVCPHHDALAAELVHGFQEELACTITDVMVRRTRIAWSRCQGLDALSLVTDLFQRYGRWSDEKLQRQLNEYRRFLADGLAFRSSLPVKQAVESGVGVSDDD